MIQKQGALILKHVSLVFIPIMSHTLFILSPNCEILTTSANLADQRHHKWDRECTTMKCCKAHIKWMSLRVRTIRQCSLNRAPLAKNQNAKKYARLRALHISSGYLSDFFEMLWNVFMLQKNVLFGLLGTVFMARRTALVPLYGKTLTHLAKRRHSIFSFYLPNVKVHLCQG